MASTIRRPLSAALMLGSAIGVIALCGMIDCRAASAQDVPVGLGDPLTGSAGIDDGGLRGTSPALDNGLAPLDATIDPTAPDQNAVPRPRPGGPPTPEPSTAKLRNGPPLLPALQPYATYNRPRNPAVGSLDQPALAGTLGPTVAALPTTPLRHAVADPTPFAPLGFTLGTLRLTPFFEQSLGYDSNPDQVAVGIKPSAFSRTEGGFDLLSLWSANELRANMHAGYNDFFSNPDANRPDAAGTVDYRLDVTRDITVDAAGRFAITTQRPGSPELNVDVRDRPLVSSFGTTVGGSDTLGRLTLGLHGTFDRDMYENGVLPDGTIVSLADETYNDYGIVARADYELTPVLKPFAEVTLDTRIHDQRIDNSGYARDSDGISARIGTTFELTSLLTGTISGGYENRTYDDRRLRDLRGPLVDATLAYAVTPLTTLTLVAGTSFNETTVIGSPGSESRSVSLQVSHALLRNLTLTGIVGYLNTDYIDSNIVENTVSTTLRASYNVSRSVVIDASYNYETLKSSIPLSSFSQNVFLVGVRLQH